MTGRDRIILPALLAIAAAGLVVAGCDKKKDKPPSSPADEAATTEAGTGGEGGVSGIDWGEPTEAAAEPGAAAEDLEPTPPPPPVEDKAKKAGDKLVADGLMAAESGNLAGAAASFKQSLEVNPASYQAAYNLGVLAERDGKLTTAKNYYKQAVSANPSYGPAVKAYTFLLLRTSSLKTALAFVEPKYAKYPESSGVAVAYAELLTMDGKISKAIDVAKGALKQDETDVDAMLALARAYIQNEQHEFARFILTMAEKNDPSLPEIYYLRSQVFAATDFGYLAKADLVKAIELKPDFVEALVNLAVMELDGGSFEDAAAHLEKAIALVPDSSEIHLDLGEAYRGMRQWDKAYSHFKKAEELGADKADVALDLAFLFFAADSIAGMSRVQILENSRTRFLQFRDLVGSKKAGEVIDIELTLKQIDKMIKLQKKVEEKKKAAASGGGGGEEGGEESGGEE
jgi:tetratricopeptide (TPR) repeat protein